MFDLGSLNPQQRDAVVTHRGPVLILAGAGTGKTRTLTCRIAHMIRKGISPDHILAVTFTNKAAKEMLERVNEMVPRERNDDGSKPARPTICTFHSLCVRILRQHIELLGYKRNFVIYDQGDQQSAMRKVLSSISGKGVKSDPGAVLAAVSKIKNAGPKGVSFTEPGLAALAEHVMKRYESALRASNAVDFDDLILLTIRLFREFPEALDACRARWPYVMVDEYQDTNGSQFELIHSLTRESRNLCVVGDDDQSIYGWRGAEIANILEMETHFPEVKIIKLEQNYRSTNTILKAANTVIGRNARRRGKTLWSAKGEGEKIMIQAFAHDDEESQTVVDNIEYDRIARRIPWGHQAVLFRTNMQSRPLETALRKGRIRYRLIGGQSFFDRREIRDFLAYVKTFVNPHDDVALLRIANTPARGLSDVTMERLISFSAERHASVYTVMQHTDVLESFRSNTRDSILGFVQFIQSTQAPVETKDRISLSAWAEDWLEKTGYLNELRKSEKDQETADNRVRNIRELIMSLNEDAEQRLEQRQARNIAAAAARTAAAQAAKTPGGITPTAAAVLMPPKPEYKGTPLERLNEFLADLTLDQEREEEDEKAGDTVTLITVHAAKGLEFPHVHIVGIEDGLMPHARSKLEGTMDEERRLFYVALTRAQETLRLTHCAARRKYGQLLPCHPSPFLLELPPECVEHADAAAAKPVEAASGADLFAAMRAALE